MNNIHFPPNHPARPGDPLRQIENLAVRSVELNIEVLKNRFSEPGHIFSRTLHQGIEIGEVVLAHEPGQVSRIDVFSSGSPNELTFECKFFAHQIASGGCVLPGHSGMKLV